jgi:hypothetical protein
MDVVSYPQNMSWITVISSMNAGICLALAGVHFLVWLRARDSRANLLFSLSAAGADATAFIELAQGKRRRCFPGGPIEDPVHQDAHLAVLAIVRMATSR